MKARAREQQARAVAAVVEATARTRKAGPGYPPLSVSPFSLGHTVSDDRPPPGQLHVVNGLPSSIYSSTNTTLSPTSPGSGPSAHQSKLTGRGSSISPLLAGASTPNLIANYSAGYFDGAVPSGSSTATSPPVSPLVNPFATPPSSAGPLQSVESIATVVQTRSGQETPKAGLPAKRTAPLVIKKKSVPPISAIDASELAENNQEMKNGGAKQSRPTSVKRKSSTPPSASPTEMTSNTVPFRVVKPSLETLEKAMSIALFFEQYYHSLLRAPAVHAHATPHAGNYVLNRARRLAHLETSFGLPENRYMSDAEKQARRDELTKEENMILRERRRKVDAKSFEMGRVIGHGAFGVVRIARERQSGRLVAIKQLRKAE